MNQPKQPLPYSAYTIYYEHGHVTKIVPAPPNGYYEDRDIVYSGTNIIIDGQPFDLTDVRSIYSIPIPKYHLHTNNPVSNSLGVTGTLDYALRMRSGRYWNERSFLLSMACIEKATQLMRFSSVGWSKRDYYRVVNDLRGLGCLKRAQQWKKWIDAHIPDDKEVVANTIRERFISAKELHSDLVEVGDICACCEKCAKYRRRVYSTTGRDRRFPKFPKDFHLDCGLSVWPYVYGVGNPSFECVDVIAYSNRPFVDDRTEEEKVNYEKRKQSINQRNEYEYPIELNKIIYYQLCMLIPSEVPKSLSGFSRMKNANSKRYQDLVQKAIDAGFVFPQSIDDVWNWNINR